MSVKQTYSVMSEQEAERRRELIDYINHEIELLTPEQLDEFATELSRFPSIASARDTITFEESTGDGIIIRKPVYTPWSMITMSSLRGIATWLEQRTSKCKM